LPIWKKGPNSNSTVPSNYVGGDVRIATDSDTHIAIGFHGVGLSDKDVYSLGVLQHLLGGGNLETPRTLGGSTSRLYKNIVGKNKSWIKEAFAFNINYSDTGLFGVYAIAEQGSNTQLFDNITKELSSIISKPADASSIDTARSKFKIDIFTSTETRANLLEFLAQRALFNGKVQTPEDFAKGADGVTPGDVQRIAKRVFSSKPTLVVLGDVQHVPTVDTISKSLKWITQQV